MVEQKTVYNLNEIIVMLEGHKMEYNSVILEGLIEQLNNEILAIEKNLQDGTELWKKLGMDDLVECENCEEINEIEFLDIIAGKKEMRLYRCRQCGNRWEL